MSEELFRGRERAFEAEWANRHDAELIEKLRQKDRLEAITEALAKKLQADDPALLQRAIDMGVTLDTGPAFLLAPLVQIAWADGTVTEQEREAVLRLAVGRGMEPGSAPYAQLIAWLHRRPTDELFDTAIEILRAGFGVLPAPERDARVYLLAEACHEVAAASGGGLWHALGLSSGVSKEESAFLDHIKTRLRA